MLFVSIFASTDIRSFIITVINMSTNDIKSVVKLFVCNHAFGLAIMNSALSLSYLISIFLTPCVASEPSSPGSLPVSRLIS
jgi:hypothetical protein